MLFCDGRNAAAAVVRAAGDGNGQTVFHTDFTAVWILGFKKPIALSDAAQHVDLSGCFLRQRLNGVQGVFKGV